MIHRRCAISIGLKAFVLLLAIGLSAACAPSTPTPAGSIATKAPASNVLKIYTRPDQFAPQALGAFEQKYGAKVTLTTYSNEPELLNTLQTGPTDFDLALVSGYMIPQLRTDNQLMPLNKENLPNLKNLLPEFLTSRPDPGLRNCVPYQWSTIGVGYNPNLTGYDVVTWADFFSPTHSLRLALPNSPRVILGTALLASGDSPNTTDFAALKRAQTLLTDLQNRVITYTVSPVQQLLDGSAASVIDRTGSLIKVSRQNPTLKYVLPHEGALRVTDYVCLMKDTPNQGLAETFINELLTPEAGLATVRFTGQSSPNQAVVAQLSPAEQTDPLMYPAADSELSERLFRLVDLGPDDSLYDNAWNNLQTAH